MDKNLILGILAGLGIGYFLFHKPQALTSGVRGLLNGPTASLLRGASYGKNFMQDQNSRAVMSSLMQKNRPPHGAR